MNQQPNNFVFWGTSRFSVLILEDLKNKYNVIPSLIVATPNQPKGRKQIMTSPETKTWAEQYGIEVFQPAKLKIPETQEKLKGFDFFIVASYGKIIPESVLLLPARGTLNVHPSLLPLYRGASPLQFQILAREKKVGTTIMLMDKEMDHGPVLAQKTVSFEDPHLGTYEYVEEKMAHESADLLAETLMSWLDGKTQEQIQDHSQATFTKMITKEDGEINLDDDPEKNYQKYLAYHSWPKVFFFTEENGIKKRNIVTDASFENGQFKILKIIPEGKTERPYQN